MYSSSGGCAARTEDADNSVTTVKKAATAMRENVCRATATGVEERIALHSYPTRLRPQERDRAELLKPGGNGY